MWSYSGDPSTSTMDKVRFLIGDTDPDAQQLSDAEINAMLTDNGSEPYVTSIVLVERLIAKYSRKVNKSIGDLSIGYGQWVDNYRKLLAQLRMRASIEGAAPKLTAMSQSEKDANEADSSLVKPNFKLGMMDYPGTSSTDDLEE